MRRELERIEIPAEHEARERAFSVMSAAHAAREPTPRRATPKPLLALVLAALALTAVLSPPGRSVVERVRVSVGVEGAQPALFSLPAPGRLLVDSPTGPWLVERDGSKRLLGDYREASWSPFGRFVVASRQDELVALDPAGNVRWSLARPLVRAASWGGSRTDTRIAYVSGSTLRVVAGDGTGDRLVARGVAAVAPAWLPRAPHVLTYVTRGGRVITRSIPAGRELWRAARGTRVDRLEWSTDGRRLLVLRSGRVELRTRAGVLVTGIRPAAGVVTIATFRPGSHAVAYVVFLMGRSRVNLLDEPSRTLFAGPGRIAQLAWSPDGSRVLVSWREADQWLFVPRARGRIKAVATISSQFEGFPTRVSWCCSR